MLALKSDRKGKHKYIELIHIKLIMIRSSSLFIFPFFFKFFRIIIVRTRFGLNPKTGMDPGPQSPSNKFVECRIKS